MSISAMKQALEALVELNEVSKGPSAVCLPAEIDTAMDALRQAIAEAEKQVSYSGNGTAGRENMTAPTGYFFQMPKREWVGLTDEELKPFCDENYIAYGAYTVDFIKAIEAKLKEKNCG